MADKHDILTVALPTRDRPQTLKYAIQTIIAQDNPHIEILVSDNFSGPEVKAVVDEFDDPRLRYIRTEGRMGMSEHWDFVLENVTGDWITIVGDDDGLLPGAVDKFFALAEKHPDVKAITAANCWFRWPTEGTENDGKLCIISGKGYEVRDCKQVIDQTMHGEIISLPTIYTGGFLHMDVINKIKAKSPGGKFFQSIIPDVFSGFAVASVEEQYIYCYEALGMAGASKFSNGRQHKNKTKEEMEKLDFHQENTIPFHPTLNGGTTESMHVLLYESFLQTQHLRDEDFGVTLEQQLELAISHSGRRVREDVIEYCRVVAEKNGLEFEPILKRANSKRLAFRLSKFVRKFKNKIGTSKLPRKLVKDDSIVTVYDAAERAGKMVA